VKRRVSDVNDDEENVEANQEGVSVSGRFFLLLFLGFVLVVVGVVVVLVAAVLGGGSVSGGAVIFIGPFPIVVGAGPDVEWLVLVGIILAVLSVVLFFVMNRKMRRFEV
jgi:uncharacterized membrane protein